MQVYCMKQNQSLFKIGYSPLIMTLVQQISTHVHTQRHVSLRLNYCNLKQNEAQNASAKAVSGYRTLKHC